MEPKAILSVLVFGLIFFFAQSAVGQTVSSINAALQQVDKSLADNEAKVIQANAALQPNLSSAITELIAKPNLTSLVMALKGLRDLTAQFPNASSYKTRKNLTTCDSIAVRASELPFDIERCNKVGKDLSTIDSMLLTQINTLKQFPNLKTVLSSAQLIKVQAIITTAGKIADGCTQYNLTDQAAASSYAKLLTQLTAVALAQCSCPAQLPSAAVTIFKSIDGSLRQLEMTLNTLEAKIRATAHDTVNKTAIATTDFKSAAAFQAISTALAAVSSLATKFFTFSNADAINATYACSDAMNKIALLAYKIEKYYKAEAEAGSDVNMIATLLGSLNASNTQNLKSFNAAQKKDLPAVITSLSNLSDAFKQYLKIVTASTSKYAQFATNATAVRLTYCNCTSKVATSKNFRKLIFNEIFNPSTIFAATTLKPTSTSKLKVGSLPSKLKVGFNQIPVET